ncbi:MAG: hypothetical protein ACREP1_09135, partial [Rhodanobacteraceae bacterium]
YDTLANDTRLDAPLRNLAQQAKNAVGSIVLAHKESKSFEPFDGSNYSDAVGPTTHVPVNAKQVDPWAPHVSETNNRFYAETDAAELTGVLA